MNIITKLMLLFCFVSSCTFTVSANVKDKKIVVALDGSGDYTKIQQAIDAVPANNQERTIIFIKNGLYNTEKIIVPSDKKLITFKGESREKTIISYHIYDCTGGLNNKCPAEDVAKWTGQNIRTSASVTIQGDGFTAENITFQNTAGAVGQALAIFIASDKNVFVNCSFLGYQDTMLLGKDGTRSYFKSCLVLGRTDYIYGGGIGYFDTCEIRSYGGGWITAPSTPKDQKYGFVFNNCKLTFVTKSPRANDDKQPFSLGRPWHNYPKVAWINCDMAKELNPLGWPTTWRMDYAATSTDLHLYEYKNKGEGASMSNRAKWAGLKELSSSEATAYSLENVVKGTDNWNPNKQ
ncbi:pectinesterase family protein [Flavobacterium seoulense]|uniref:Por secretion system C-terminal sorting domain-containing protein n=1 Tax=Flavobacterium seoulense TaxID=1492738 RepID=A0A066X0H6_9FLAO|nr:pectinesterase family protein [Flavobacterium seoulense]KDN56689.1 Por secretion system C-terminal sorting domain-containing protein [Flavobacterium seoulense]